MRYVLFAALLLVACERSPTSPGAGALVISAVSGNAQVVPAGELAPIPIVVSVTLNSKPVVGDTVTFVNLTPDDDGEFTVGAPTDGPVIDETITFVVTDSTGTARIGWEVSDHAGTDSLSASVAGAAAVIFTATAMPGPVFGYAKFAGDAQAALAGSSLTILPAVKVNDQFGNNVPGVSVTFALSGGGGSISGANAMTDAQGVATLGGWTLGVTPGLNTVTAYIAGSHGVVVPIEFTEHGTAPSSATTVASWKSWFSPMMSAPIGNPPSWLYTSLTSVASSGSSKRRSASNDSPGPTGPSSGTVISAGLGR
jgi:adhesin/invasin